VLLPVTYWFKPFKFSNTPNFFSFKEPTIAEDYERIRDKQVAENQRVFEDHRLNTFASEFRDNLNHAIMILLNWRFAILTHMSVTVVAPTCQ
jgi:hypothetical protein